MNLDRLYFAGDAVDAIAVAACITRLGTEHAAIAFVDADEELKLLHFLIDGSIRSMSPNDKYIFVVPNVLQSTRSAFAGLCESLANNEPMRKIYYDFGVDPNAHFSFEDGRCDLVTSEPGTGLSCSTFVAAIFNSVKRPLVDCATWEHRHEDLVAHSRLLDVLSEHQQGARAARLKSRIASIRVSPTDVAGAALEDELPASFSTCCRNTPVITEALVLSSAMPPGGPAAAIQILRARFQPNPLSRLQCRAVGLCRRAVNLFHAAIAKCGRIRK